MPESAFSYSPDGNPSFQKVIQASHQAFRDAFVTFGGQITCNGSVMKIKSKKYGDLTMKILNESSSGYQYDFYYSSDKKHYEFQKDSVFYYLTDNLGGDYTILY